MNAPSPSKDAMRQMKSLARLYAVQALFQMESGGQTIEAICDEFEAHRIGAPFGEEGSFAPGDLKHFRALVDHAVTWQARIDQMSDRALSAAWPIERIDPVLRALFRAAGAELSQMDTPPKVVINEFVELAKAFFPEGKEPKFVNAVLNHMMHEEPPLPRTK